MQLGDARQQDAVEGPLQPKTDLDLSHWGPALRALLFPVNRSERKSGQATTSANLSAFPFFTKIKKVPI